MNAPSLSLPMVMDDEGALPPAVKRPPSHLPVTYQTLLRDFLLQPDEATRQQAYELGRAALNSGLGVFDVIRLHHQALIDGVLPCDFDAAHFAPALESFLLEVLSPFEAAHRGFRRALERLQQVNLALGERNDALSSLNAKLQEEIKTRQRTEAELRESKEHYCQLFNQAHAMEESLRDLSARVLTAQEEERKRISRDLHDEIGQALTAVNVAVAMLKKQTGDDAEFQRKLADAEQLLAQSMETVHRFARELRPAMLDHLGLHSALRAYLTNFNQQTGIDLKLTTHPALAQLNGQCGEVVFRVVQEALSNVHKHAQATDVKIEFTADAHGIGMAIVDNGCGRPIQEKMTEGKTNGRLGLLGMQERLRLVGGTFAIDSAPGQGTRIHAQIPFQPAPSGATPTKPAAARSKRSSPPFPVSTLHEENIRSTR